MKIAKLLKTLAVVLGVLLLVVAAYLIYVIASYKRLPDNLSLSVEKGAGTQAAVTCGEEYMITTYNIGFGAYTPTYSFFMDGGKSSWAESRESVVDVIQSAAQRVKEELAPDFMFWQEVDLDATRSYHVNEYELLKAYYESFDKAFAQNYDSAFLFYPFTQPHGKSRAGIVTMSAYEETASLRRSLPISDSFSKFLDLTAATASQGFLWTTEKSSA